MQLYLEYNRMVRYGEDVRGRSVARRDIETDGSSVGVGGSESCCPDVPGLNVVLRRRASDARSKGRRLRRGGRPTRRRKESKWGVLTPRKGGGGVVGGIDRAGGRAVVPGLNVASRRRSSSREGASPSNLSGSNSNPPFSLPFPLATSLRRRRKRVEPKLVLVRWKRRERACRVGADEAVAWGVGEEPGLDVSWRRRASDIVGRLGRWRAQR
ncbi:hypothetical protein R3P38DRAFT_2793078 [Favolaschia claudopus]|uniref:Uncharacterized protein n=1 Tax=Favolaschia claudopus TaxID=2862362 RepID=A0AAW0AE79_9AGAR